MGLLLNRGPAPDRLRDTPLGMCSVDRTRPRASRMEGGPLSYSTVPSHMTNEKSALPAVSNWTRLVLENECPTSSDKSMPSPVHSPGASAARRRVVLIPASGEGGRPCLCAREQ